MSYEVKSNIDSIAHTDQDALQAVEVVSGYLYLSQAEIYWRYQVIEFDRIHFLHIDLSYLRTIPFVFREDGGVMNPWDERLIGRQMHFGRLAPCIRFSYTGFRG